MLTVGGIEQPAVAVLSSTAVFKVTDAPSKALSGVRLYLDIGIPEGNRTLLDNGVTLTPTLSESLTTKALKEVQ